MTIISTLPPAPSRADPSTFATKADTLLGALDGFVTETNLVAGEVNTNATTATTQATLAATQVGLAALEAANAANSAILASSFADAAASSANATVWVSGTTYVIGDSRYSPINLQTYRRKTNGAGTTDPSLDDTNWVLAVNLTPSAGTLYYSALTFGAL